MIPFTVGRPSREAPWREKARIATGLLVRSMAHLGDPAERIREKVILAAREALGERPGREMHEVQEVPTADGLGEEMSEVVTSAGIFRLVIVNQEVDRRDPMLAESFMDVVQKTLALELANNAGRPRPTALRLDSTVPILFWSAP